MSKRFLTLILVLGSIFPSANAQDCGALVVQVRDLSPSSFNEYPQLNDMKQDVLLILYRRERATCPENIASTSIFTVRFINEFEQAYNLSKNPDPESRDTALENSLKLVEYIRMQGKTVLSAENQNIMDSANRALKEFLLAQAGVYMANVEAASATGEKISNYKKATKAYEGAGETIEAENLRLKWQALEMDYLSDLKTAEQLVSQGDTKFSMAKPMLAGNIFSKAEAYILSRSASIDYTEAQIYYNFHSELEMIAIVSEKISSANNTMADLKQTIRRYFVLSLISLMGLSLYVLNRLKSWHGDAYDYSLGNELVRVSSGAD